MLGKVCCLLLLASGISALRKCRNNELCITEQLCDESDDSGRGVLAPRSLDRSCGVGLVCCDKEQLESYEADLAIRLRLEQLTNLTQISTQSNDKKSNPNAYQTCEQHKFCVPRHLCRSGVINDDGKYIIRPRIDKFSNSGCATFETCCSAADQVSSSHAACKSTVHLIFHFVFEQLSESENPMYRHLSEFKYPGCGYSNPQGLYFDLVGYDNHEARFAEFPWMVAIMDMQANYVCGGTLIHPQLVLSSAHNVANYSSDALLARAGEYDLKSQREPHPYQTSRLRSILPHEFFNKLNFHNDIALLVLEKPFQLAPHVQPLCLPAPAQNATQQNALLEAECLATGWGHHNISAKSLEHILKRIDLPIVEHEQCQRLLRRTILGLHFRLHSSFVCAGGVEGKDTCQGDGGSPLFCSIAGEKNRYQLVGIVSWGIECAAKDIPAAYANVTHLRTWIDDQATRLGFKLD